MTPSWLDHVAWMRSVERSEGSFRWGRMGADYVCLWPGLLALVMDERGSVKGVVPGPAATDAVVEKLTQGEGAAFARHLRGRLSLHASAVELGGRALAFVGDSGAGKSTLAHELCQHLGASLLADDVAGLRIEDGHIEVEPSEGSVWLDDGAGGKAPRPLRRAAEPVPLAALVFLRVDAGVSVPEALRMRGAAIVTSVLEAVFRFDIAPALWCRELYALADLAAAVPVWEVRRASGGRPEDLAELLARLSHLNGGR